MDTLHDLSFDQLCDELAAAGVNRSHGASLFKVLHDGLEIAAGQRDDLSPPLQRWLNSADVLPVRSPELVEEIGGGQRSVPGGHGV